MDRVREWLEQLGLGEYAAVFAENAVDEEILPDLTDADLKDLGIVKLGHRKKLLKAVAALQATDRLKIPPAKSSVEAPKFVPQSQDAERRQLTVVFCDLIGSTALSQRLDPEDLSDINRAYHDVCKSAIDRYEGFVARYLGDGVLAYFGYPQAHEDDAERGVRAGLAIVESLAALNERLAQTHDVELSVRIGVATGPVVVGEIVGEGAAEEAAVVGETPNLSARLQGLAGSNQVMISAATRRLLGALFEYEDLGPHELKGIEQPVQGWRVVREASVGSRDGAKWFGNSLPLVGRHEELGLLLRSWEASKEGRGQAVLIQGEAGIGKSRLVDALRERLSRESHISIVHRCSPLIMRTALSIRSSSI